MFIDPNWRSEIDSALNDMDSTCVGLGLLTQVPEKFNDIDTKLKVASVDMGEAIIYFRTGIENSDVDTINLGTQNLAEANTLILEVNEMINEINP